VTLFSEPQEQVWLHARNAKMLTQMMAEMKATSCVRCDHSDTFTTKPKTTVDSTNYVTSFTRGRPSCHTAARSVSDYNLL